jgi:RNA-directed DNA polymerase
MEPDARNTIGPKPDNSVSTKQARIAELATSHRGEALTNIQRFLDVAWLQEAYERTRKDGAPGIDGETWTAYGENLMTNLESLEGRIKSRTYRAPPVKRAHIPKGDGLETRPIGIPTLEDRVAQRAVVMLLEPILEREFLNGSYGFRPKRSAHQALAALRQGIEEEGTQWIVEVDIRKFFDTIDHQHLRQMIRQRVSDGVVTRMIDVWLKAGVLEGGVWSSSDEGTPQGGVISPLLANLYLHDVLDTWLEGTVRPYMHGRFHWVRYADDFVIGCETKRDAEMLMRVLPKRFGRYGLTLHPDKTRLVPFGRPVQRGGLMRDGSKPGKFDFLGFTHMWAETRGGIWKVKRKTSSKRFTRAVKAVDAWLKKNRHQPTSNQHQSLRAKVQGHCAYYGIAGNLQSLKNFSYEVLKRWRTWLNRRGNKVSLTWAKFWGGVNKHFPMPVIKIVHPTC